MQQQQLAKTAVLDGWLQELDQAIRSAEHAAKPAGQENVEASLHENAKGLLDELNTVREQAD